MDNTNIYKKEHYDRITLLVKKGDKEFLTGKAEEAGMSVSSYILSFLPELPSRENAEKPSDIAAPEKAAARKADADNHTEKKKDADSVKTADTKESIPEKKKSASENSVNKQKEASVPEVKAPEAKLDEKPEETKPPVKKRREDIPEFLL